MYYPEMIKYFSDDVEYHLPDSLDAIGGVHRGLPAVTKMLDLVFTHFYDPEQVGLEIQHSFADATSATMLFIIDATLRWGEKYRNRYAITIETADGKVTRVHEYLDTKQLVESLDPEQVDRSLSRIREGLEAPSAT